MGFPSKQPTDNAEYSESTNCLCWHPDERGARSEACHQASAAASMSSSISSSQEKKKGMRFSKRTNNHYHNTSFSSPIPNTPLVTVTKKSLVKRKQTPLPICPVPFVRSTGAGDDPHFTLTTTRPVVRPLSYLKRPNPRCRIAGDPIKRLEKANATGE